MYKILAANVIGSFLVASSLFFYYNRLRLFLLQEIEMESKDRIIFALDAQTGREALNLVKELYPVVGCFKFGLVLIHVLFNELLNGLSKDRAVVQELFELLDGNIFWDGKFHDIPNTVSGASRALKKLNVRMFNVHASSGVPAMKKAVKNKGDAMVLAVTILTSLEEAQIFTIYGRMRELKVLDMANEAVAAGVDGIICSPKELITLNGQQRLRSLKKIVPGIRPKWAPANDQKRIMTPRDAVRAGADFLVIGRPIKDPPKEIGTSVDATCLIAQEIEEAEKDK